MRAKKTKERNKKLKAAKLRPLYPNDNNVTAGGDALPGAAAHPLDIPAFLKISAERRKEAWKNFRRVK